MLKFFPNFADCKNRIIIIPDMANEKIQDKDAIRQENIEQGVSKAQEWLDNNKKTLYTILGVAVVLALIILAFVKFVYQPKCEEAQEQTFPAEMNFQKGEYELALNGDGNVLGFSEIIDTYGTKAGKAVYLYAGICQLQLGNFEEAIKFLQKYSGKEPILSARAKACEGDAYVGLGQYDAAIKCFQAAAAKGDDLFAAGYLLKEGLAWEKLGDKAAALAAYKKISDMYPQSLEAYDIDKYISRVSE